MYAKATPIRTPRAVPDLSTVGEHLNNWDKAATLAHKSPTVIGLCSGLLYMGRILKSGDSITRGKLLGGIIICVITGYGTYLGLGDLHVTEGLRVLVSLGVGASCDAGLGAIMDRAVNIIRGADDQQNNSHFRS